MQGTGSKLHLIINVYKRNCWWH